MGNDMQIAEFHVAPSHAFQKFAAPGKAGAQLRRRPQVEAYLCEPSLSTFLFSLPFLVFFCGFNSHNERPAF